NDKEVQRRQNTKENSSSPKSKPVLHSTTTALERRRRQKDDLHSGTPSPTPRIVAKPKVVKKGATAFGGSLALPSRRPINQRMAVFDRVKTTSGRSARERTPATRGAVVLPDPERPRPASRLHPVGSPGEHDSPQPRVENGPAHDAVKREHGELHQPTQSPRSGGVYGSSTSSPTRPRKLSPEIERMINNLHKDNSRNRNGTKNGFIKAEKNAGNRWLNTTKNYQLSSPPVPDKSASASSPSVPSVSRSPMQRQAGEGEASPTPRGDNMLYFQDQAMMFVVEDEEELHQQVEDTRTTRASRRSSGRRSSSRVSCKHDKKNKRGKYPSTAPAAQVTLNLYEDETD
ncbi:unnamed protein product, partial [Amoebophrya sp. A25]